MRNARTMLLPALSGLGGALVCSAVAFGTPATPGRGLTADGPSSETSIGTRRVSVDRRYRKAPFRWTGRARVYTRPVGTPGEPAGAVGLGSPAPPAHPVFLVSDVRTGTWQQVISPVSTGSDGIGIAAAHRPGLKVEWEQVVPSPASGSYGPARLTVPGQAVVSRVAAGAFGPSRWLMRSGVGDFDRTAGRPGVFAPAGPEPATAYAETPGGLRAGLLRGSQPYDDIPKVVGKRSVPLAFGMSAVVPGLGQVYNRQWLKAGIIAAIEVALVVTYISRRNQGQETEDAFVAFAHADWNPGQYASWLNDYSDWLELEHGANVTEPPISIPDIDFTRPESWSSAERTEVDSFFGEIQRTEGQMFHPQTGASFSHRLPNFGEQQYYELIGKYFQFAPGWLDYPAWVNEDGYTEAIDPEVSNPDGSKKYVSDSFYQYAEDHAESQDFFRDASRISSVILLNHIVAAIDAAVFSKIHNDRLAASVSVRTDIDGATRPVARLTVKI